MESTGSRIDWLAWRLAVTRSIGAGVFRGRVDGPVWCRWGAAQAMRRREVERLRCPPQGCKSQRGPGGGSDFSGNSEGCTAEGWEQSTEKPPLWRSAGITAAGSWDKPTIGPPRTVDQPFFLCQSTDLFSLSSRPTFFLCQSTDLFSLSSRPTFFLCQSTDLFSLSSRPTFFLCQSTNLFSLSVDRPFFSV